MESTFAIVILWGLFLFVVWLISEFNGPRWLRITAGTVLMLWSTGLALVGMTLEQLNSNAWFGTHTKELVDATVAELQRGRQTEVLIALTQLQSHYHPSYETRAQYDQLVQAAIEQMTAIPQDTVTAP